jgi:SAM-dependent methyltransferase
MRSCPVCRSDNIAPLNTVSSADAAQHFVLREEYPERHVALQAHIETLWGSAACDLLRCDHCGFGFCWPYVAGDGRFYNLAYPTVGYPHAKWEFDRTARELRSITGSGTRALEIGAGFGFFLDMICPRFVERRNILAVEYNDQCQEALRAKGYQSVAADVRHADFLRFEGQFDLIFMFQVLEHMDDLDVLMQRLKFIASPKCHIFIAVPNARRIAFNENNGALLDMPPNHIGRWSPGAFEDVARRFGFILRKMDFEPIRFTSFLKTDLTFAYLRRAQISGSLANRTRSMRRSRLRKLLELTLVAGYAPTRARAWTEAWTQKRELGESLWVHLSPA